MSAAERDAAGNVIFPAYLTIEEAERLLTEGEMPTDHFDALLASLPDSGERLSYDYSDEDDDAIADDNRIRAARGLRSLSLYADECYQHPGGESAATALSDLLGDLFHTCDMLGVDIDAALTAAHGNHHAEQRGIL